MTDASNPSAKLTANLIDRLVAEGLLRADKKEALATKIAGGDMTGDDWRLEVDLASEKATKE